VANYFTDNEDIKFHLNDERFKTILELREKGYTDNKAYPFAPDDFEDALDNCHQALSLIGELSAEILAPAATDTDRKGCRLENNVVSYAKGTQEMINRLKQAELFGFTLPRKYGGLNFPMTVYMMAVEIVSRADASFMTLFGLQEISETIHLYASSERFLNGVKHFISNGCGDVLLVLARSEQNVQGARGLSLFLYEKDENLLVRRLEDKLGIHGSPTCELQFKNCRATLVGKRKRGLSRYVMSLMNGARLVVGAQSIGIAQEAYNQSLQYARQRKQFGKSIIEFPPVLEMLTNMRVQIEAARSLMYEASLTVDVHHVYNRYGTKDKESAAKIKELNRFAGLLTPMVKYYASEMCNKITYDAIQIFGGAGFMRDYEVERLYRDARITTIYEGTSQLQVVAAAGGITSGLFFKLLEIKISQSFPEAFNPLVEKIRECEKLLQQAVSSVKAKNDHLYLEYHARGLVDMATETLIAVLLLQNSIKSDHKFDIAKKFIADTCVRVKMLADKTINGDDLAIYECWRIIDSPI